MQIHEIKIWTEFCDPVLSGEKAFEIRYNDRCYQKGDYIQFIPWAKEDNKRACHAIDKKVYEITFVLSGFGLKENYVALGIKEARYDERR
jgi:uncharacterized protein YqfB (UPF0267 family)